MVYFNGVLCKKGTKLLPLCMAATRNTYSNFTKLTQIINFYFKTRLTKFHRNQTRNTIFSVLRLFIAENLQTKNGKILSFCMGDIRNTLVITAKLSEKVKYSKKLIC